ncbi:bifunctional metallophosphatase/5'-nucleotidase [Microbacterium sp. bgisy189]|uniref:bifunctional metallophosphatase/5'-nucleotidase n=1 Tax=Microbacterium sp. bgisy189 TaxID=3413798 RepID=UPI003EBB8909
MALGVSLSVAALALAAPASAAPKKDPPGQLIDVQVLAFNDFHGHVQPGDAGTVDGQDAGSAPYLAAKLNELRTGHKYSVTAAAGDLIGGSPFFSGLFHDEPAVESLNAMGLDVSSVGNHEFDEGVTELLRMQNGGCHPVDGCYFEDEPFAGADFQWLSANVVDEAGATPLPEYWIKKFQNVKVGFIGMTLEATDTLVAASGVRGYEFLDEVETANALVPELQAQGVEAIVVLLHEGGIPNPITVDGCANVSGPIVAINAGLDPAVDALVTGHTHMPYNCTLPDPDGVDRMVTSAYSYGRVVSEVNLVLDKRTKDVRRDLSSATNHAVLHNELTPDAAQTAIVEKWEPLAAEIGDVPVGEITGDILRGGTPSGADRGVESSAGNFAADVQQWSMSAAGSDLAFMNPGGLRSDLLYGQSSAGEAPGVVTFGEAQTFQPFNNILSTFPMTGSQIVSVLEEQCQPAGSSRPILHLGVSDALTYDLATTVETIGGVATCTSVSVTNVLFEGAPIDPGATYMVTANNFLADGGDSFTTFAEVDPADRITGVSDLEALVNYLGTYSPVTPPGTDRVNEL